MTAVAALVGPTASGKSSVAMAAAQRFGAEIVSVDSMQVYRGMDIGTAKPTAGEQARVRHHMIDLVSPEDPYSVARFQRTGRSSLDAIASSDHRALIVGGSGLHFRALVDPLEFPPSDPTVRERLEGLAAGEAVARLLALDDDAGRHVDLANPRRVLRALEVAELTGRTPSERAGTPEAVAVKEYRPLIPAVMLGLDPGGALRSRVEVRLDAMLDAGFQAEVDGLRGRLGPTAEQAVGYRQLMHVTLGEWDAAEGRRRALQATTALARRQRTYFGRDPRIRWIEWDDDAGVMSDRVSAALEEAGWTS